MIFDNFEIRAIPMITGAECRNCGSGLAQVPNGLLGAAFYCQKCKSVYELKMVKVPKTRLTNEFMQQCESSGKVRNE